MPVAGAVIDDGVIDQVQALNGIGAALCCDRDDAGILAVRTLLNQIANQE